MTVTVVGGGLAGAIAALSAARHREVRVRLLTAGETSLEAASGLIDVLGYVPGGEEPVADPFAAVSDLPAEHPYSTVGIDAVREGLALFDDIAGEQYAGDGTDRNALVPTHLGNLKPTSRYPVTVAPGVASREQRTTLVGFEELTDVDAALAADRLDRTLPYEVWGTAVGLPVELDGVPETTDLAAELDSAYDRDRARGAFERFHDDLSRDILMHDETDRRIGVPAVLGLEATEALRAELAATVESPVFEIPTGPPSVPGRRLERLLRGALETAGVELLTGHRVTGTETTGDDITALIAETGDGERRVKTEAVVLATGGLVGGGVEGTTAAVREPVFDCHVPAPEDRSEWAAETALGDHAFARFGVETDGELRPLEAGGRPEFGNLRAAGSVLGGYDFAAEKSGSGVSVATGYVAGRLAAEDGA
ncbi:MAG: glycerol-3-phosphate dehydrogenase subunit B [Natronomonas sp.]|jgi:glycerol-3-phosphate dehydrogenase subunit B